MSPQKPYLIRAIFEWLVDNGETPYLLVDATLDGVQVPEQFINEGKIVLNIEPNAVRNYHADNDWISFSARFSGKAMELFIPISAVRSIYGKESNQGMFFPEDDLTPEPPKRPEATKPDSGKNKRPGLQLVK
jgi:stringent starvation protein B